MVTASICAKRAVSCIRCKDNGSQRLCKVNSLEVIRVPYDSLLSLGRIDSRKLLQALHRRSIDQPLQSLLLQRLG